MSITIVSTIFVLITLLACIYIKETCCGFKNKCYLFGHRSFKVNLDDTNPLDAVSKFSESDKSAQPTGIAVTENEIKKEDNESSPLKKVKVVQKTGLSNT